MSLDRSRPKLKLACVPRALRLFLLLVLPSWGRTRAATLALAFLEVSQSLTSATASRGRGDRLHSAIRQIPRRTKGRRKRQSAFSPKNSVDHRNQEREGASERHILLCDCQGDGRWADDQSILCLNRRHTRQSEVKIWENWHERRKGRAGRPSELMRCGEED